MTIALRIGGRIHQGWTEATVTRSLETLCSTFRMALSERTAGETAPRAVSPGDGCTVSVDGEQVLRGYVDEVRPRYDSGDHMISVRGRDATADLVDCSAASHPGEWQNETLDQITRGLVAPFGLEVTVETDVGAPFTKFRIDEGETVFEAIERGCRYRGVLPLSDGNGGLLITHPSRARSSTLLRRGTNILAAEGVANWSDRYSEYTLLGQQAGSDFLTGEAAAHVTASARDPGVQRHRPLTIIGEQSIDTDEAEARVQWEANVRAARSRSVSVSVQGWREREGGGLWSPGQVVHLSDDWLGIDRDLLIASTAHSLSRAGTITKMTLFPPDAFVQRAEPERTPAGSGTNWWI